MGIAILSMVLMGLAAGGVVLYLVVIYNRLIGVRVNIDKSWANIEVLLKQRYDEIPNLVKVCEGYMQHERRTLENITAARTRFLEAKSPGALAQADAALGAALKSLFAVSENYPTLKANETFLQLQGRVSYLENQIADRREFYNDSVAVFNTRIKQLPDVFVANLLGYRDRELFSIPSGQQEVPKISFAVPQ